MLPAHAIPGTVEELGIAGIKGAVVLTSGFAEGGRAGRRLEEAVVRAARQYGIALVGPNCMGNVSFHANAATSFTMLFDTEPVCRGAVAVVSQSGGIGASIYALGAASGLGFSHIISGGNEAVLDLVDYVEFLIADPNTKVICAYAEQIKRGRELL